MMHQARAGDTPRWGSTPIPILTARSGREIVRSVAGMENVEYQEKPVVHLIAIGQSNAEGRGHVAEAVSPTHADRMIPASHPVDASLSGPGMPKGVGPLINAADAILERLSGLSTIVLHSTATGNRTLAEIYGTDGTDGEYALQRERVLAGEIEPGDRWVGVVCQGEADAQSPIGDWADRLLDLLTFVEGDLAGTCIGHVIIRHPPSAPSAEYAFWDELRAAEMVMADEARIPPIGVVDLVDADREPADLVHIRSAGWARVGPAIGAVVAPWIGG